MSVYFLIVSSVLLMGQTGYTIKGQVTDTEGVPLPGASVLLLPISKGTVAGADGTFTISGMPAGKYRLDISYVGYIPRADSIRVDNDQEYDFRLTLSPLSLTEIVVSDNYGERREKEEPLGIVMINDSYLKQNLGGSLVQSLTRIPGISSMDIGSGQSKPVIRGLGFNRIVVVADGVKHEGQQWGEDHGLEIDQYNIENVEIIKGPSSLLYGSDAIGGVIDLKSGYIPTENSIGGTVDLSAESNNSLLGSSFSLYGRGKRFYARARATILDYADYKVPTDKVYIYSYQVPLYKNRLRNTAGNEQNLHFAAGAVFHGFKSEVSVSNIREVAGSFANTHGLEPRRVDTELHDKSIRDIQYPLQKVNHLTIINSNKAQWDRLELDAVIGFQRNFRQEWSEYVSSHDYRPPTPPDTLGCDPDLELQFDKYIYSANFLLNYSSDNGSKLTVGMNNEFQRNLINGIEFFVPAFDRLTSGIFGIAKYTFNGNSILQLGLRYDYGMINAHRYKDWFPSPAEEDESMSIFRVRAGFLSRCFSSISWSAGYNLNYDHWSLKANIGRSFRMPDAKELAANGVNYKRFRYEIGNSYLSPEVSYQADLGTDYDNGTLSFAASPFVNYFPNYIYLNPSSEHDSNYGFGNQVYYYTQSKVFRFGGEISASYSPFSFLDVGVTGEYVYSEQLTGEKRGYTIPFSPPPSAIFNIDLRKDKFMFTEDIYLSIDYQLTAAQRNIVPPEEVTDGYRLVSVGAGCAIQIKNQKANLSLQIKNFFNTVYFDHTSYYRLINVPGPGRNIVLNLSVPFSARINGNKTIRN